MTFIDVCLKTYKYGVFFRITILFLTFRFQSCIYKRRIHQVALQVERRYSFPYSLAEIIWHKDDDRFSVHLCDLSYWRTISGRRRGKK